jgi:hypothetical protein
VEGDLVAGFRHELSEWQRHLMEPVLPANGLPGEQLRSHRICWMRCVREAVHGYGPLNPPPSHGGYLASPIASLHYSYLGMGSKLLRENDLR